MIPARSIVVLCIAFLVAQKPYASAQELQPPGTPAGQSQRLLSHDELDSLVAPVALYPDPVLSQVLVAATYPVDIVEAARWLQDHSHLSGKALAEAAAQEPWDASVQALVMLPEVLNLLYSEVRWTTDLGNAFLAQEEDVMDAVQRMRQSASANGALRSTPQQTVKTITENNQPFIVIEPASPDVVFVPVYNPVAVWGPPVSPFPVIAYPPFTGVAAASALSFGAGMAVGSFWGGGWGGWGWNPGWGRRTVIVNNNFIRGNRFNRVDVGPGNRWVRNSNRRGCGRPNERGSANRINNNRGNNRGSRPNVEQTRRRLNEAGQRGGRRTGEGSAARRQGVAGGGRQARRGNQGQGSANRMQQRRTEARQNRGGNRQANRGSANRQASRGSANRGGNRQANRGSANRGGNRQANRGSANRGVSGRGNRGGGRASANRNRGSANRSAGGSRRGGGGSRGGANRARGGGGGSRGGGRRR
jgi:hypothetical protein